MLGPLAYHERRNACLGDSVRQLQLCVYTSLAGCAAIAAACSGYLAYEDIVKQLLDGDYYAMYSPAGVDNTQVSTSLLSAQHYHGCSHCQVSELLAAIITFVMRSNGARAADVQTASFDALHASTSHQQGSNAAARLCSWSN